MIVRGDRRNRAAWPVRCACSPASADARFATAKSSGLSRDGRMAIEATLAKGGPTPTTPRRQRGVRGYGTGEA